METYGDFCLEIWFRMIWKYCVFPNYPKIPIDFKHPPPNNHELTNDCNVFCFVMKQLISHPFSFERLPSHCSGPKFAAAVDVLKPSIFLWDVFPEPSRWSKRPLGNPQLHGTYTRALKGQHVKHPTSFPRIEWFCGFDGLNTEVSAEIGQLTSNRKGEHFEKTKGAFFVHRGGGGGVCMVQKKLIGGWLCCG